MRIPPPVASASGVLLVSSGSLLPRWLAESNLALLNRKGASHLTSLFSATLEQGEADRAIHPAQTQGNLGNSRPSTTYKGGSRKKGFTKW